jgi:hypothetical protein
VNFFLLDIEINSKFLKSVVSSIDLGGFSALKWPFKGFCFVSMQEKEK